jgi:ferric-dicitrate binding protein FerR (iron transport regulator)
MGPERSSDPAAEEERLPLATLMLPAARKREIGDHLEALARGRQVRRRRAIVGVGAAALAALALLAIRWRPSPPVVTAGTRLRTGPADFQLFPLGDRGVAFVSEESDVELESGPTPTLRVRRGSVRLVVTRHHGERFVVATEAAEVVVLGTEFDVTVVGHATEVRVVRGEVEVRNAQGWRRLWPRESAEVRVGEAPRMKVPVDARIADGPAELIRPQGRGRH